jgi:hypothetical protein
MSYVSLTFCFGVVLKSLRRLELDKSYDTFMASNSVTNNMKSYSRSPVNRSSHLPTAQTSAHANSNGNGNGAPNSKIPPTGPRAYKKPRLSEPPLQSPSRSAASLPSAKPASSHSQTYHRERSTTHTRDHRPRDVNSHSSGDDPRGKSSYAHRKIVVDEDSRKRPRSPAMDRELDRDRDRDTDRLRDRERERERERDRLPRRNGSHSGGGERSGSGRRVARGGTPNSGSGYGNTDRDRTLAERMGLSTR